MKDFQETSTPMAQQSPAHKPTPPPPVPPKSSPPTQSFVNNPMATIQFPEQVQCVQCRMFKPVKDTWWCRSCQKTLCSTCNLMQGHTEHRTAPWRPEELVRSLVDANEARCAARSTRAAEEESAIKEYMREIETYFLNKLHRQLDERNEEDRALNSLILDACGISIGQRKRWPPASHSATPAGANSTTGSTTSLHPPTLVGFDLLTDDSVARLVNEIARLLPPDGVRTLTTTSNGKLPRLISSARNSASSSPLLGAERRAFFSTSTTNNKTTTSDSIETADGRSPPTNATGRFYSFAAVLPDIEPSDFAQLLEQQRDFSPRTRSRSQSGPIGVHQQHHQGRSSTPFLEHVGSRAQSPAPPGSNGTSLSVYGSIDVDSTNNSMSSENNAVAATRPKDHRRSIIVTQAITHHDAAGQSPQHNRGTSSINGGRHDDGIEEEASSVQLMISEDTQTSSSSWLTSATQTDLIGNGSINMTSTPNGSTPNGGNRDMVDAAAAVVVAAALATAAAAAVTPATPPTADISLDSTKSTNGESNGTGGSGSISITAFHFGDDYLSRPIDVRPLPNGRLAVSDSCGGVYITDSNGSIQHQINLDGLSASSLCYLTTNRPEQFPPLLLVSVLRKKNRSVHFYDAGDFTLLDTVDCPAEPPIDLGRSRWMAADDRGALYMVSGDGKLSALWKYFPATKGWNLLKKARKTRYQYLDVVHTQSDPATVTLLTCDGLCGSLLLITISRSSNGGQSRIVGEQDFSHTYGLHRHIHSPASAVVDHLGNMLILDYSTGKLWLLRAPAANSNGSDTDRRLRALIEVGPQQGIGLSVTAPWDSGTGRPYGGEHWCYVACFNKKRVHAVKYLND